MKTLTISVAAYNVDRTLEKTLSSFDDPRVYDDLEVLIIDDGSKDNTKKIAEKYARKAPNTFKYIPKKHTSNTTFLNILKY